MSITVGLIGLAALIVMLFLGMNVGFSMVIVGFLGVAILKNFGAALGFLMGVPFTTVANYSLSVIPLFVLMGQFAFHSGISEDLFKLCYKWFGRIPGGLGVAAIGATTGFCAVCGSSTATTATMGVVCLPEMRRYKYANSLSTGSIAAGGTLGILIPPSVGFILYGITASESIGRLFAAGIIPGLMLAVLYVIVIIIQASMKPELGPKGDVFPMSEKIKALLGVLPIIVLFIIVVGGIFAGYFTPNEGAAVGSFGAFLFLIFRRKCTIKVLYDALTGTIKTSCMILLLMIGTNMFGYFLQFSMFPTFLANLAMGMNVSRYLILVIILLVYVVLACVMDSLSMILLLGPIFLPVITGFGMDLVWFGVLMVMVTETGLITPPVGLNVIIMHNIAKDVPLGTIYRGVFPFLLALFVGIALVLVFPQIALWFPNLIYG